MFFNAKEIELNVFADSDEVKAADETIHSFVNESGEIKILDYAKSPTEENIRKICKSFAANESGKALSEISSLMEDSIGEIGKQVDQFTV